MFKSTKRNDFFENTFDIKIYIIVCIIFLIGIITGAIYFRIVINDIETKNNFVNTLSLTQNTNVVTKKDLLYKSAIKNVKLLVLFWIVGISAVGSPFLLLYCLIRGASLSFAISTVIFKFGFVDGNLYSFKHLFLHSCFTIFAMILLTVSSIRVSLNTLKNKKDIRLEIFRHSIVSIISLIILTFSTILEAVFSLWIKTRTSVTKSNQRRFEKGILMIFSWTSKDKYKFYIKNYKKILALCDVIV